MKRLLLIVVLMLAAGAAAPVPQAQWRRLDSPNFVVIGEAGGSELRDIAVKFEAFREVLGRILNEKVTTSPVPTVVVVFRGEATFRPFMPVYQGKRVDVGGLFVPRRDINYIALVADGNEQRLPIIFHEYSHLLVSNTGQRLPVWFNEGLAEYYSTFELQTAKAAVIGRVIESHIQELNEKSLLKLPDLLGVKHDSPLYNEGNRRSVFYAQSWALLHMILRSENSRLPQLATYLDGVSRGMAPMDAWNQAFAGQDLQRELDTYIRRRAFTATLYTFSDRIAGFSAQPVPIPPADVDAFLAEFLVERGALDEAEARLASAAKRDASSPRVKIANASLASARGNFESAEKLARDAGEADDWLLNYRAGIELAEALQGRRSVTQADVDLSRRYFDRAKAGRPEFANAIARAAALELGSSAGPTKDTRASLERAVAIAPGRHEYSLLLANVLGVLSDFEAAKSVLGPLMHPLNPEQVREAARSLLGRIAAVENARASGTRPPAQTASSPAGTSTSTVTTEIDGPAVRPLFRQLKSGEQRLEGTLEAIECVAGKGVTFRVKTAAETVALTSPYFTSVEFITYRKDLTGSIQCGKLASPMPVYVTWRPASAADSKMPVAIEFLPVK